MTETRNRGSILLDPNKVKLAASKLNKNSCSELKKHYLDYHENVNFDTKVVNRAWNGKIKIDINSAQKIAQSLGLNDYSVLLCDDLSIALCAWQKLISNEAYQENFVSFIDHSNLNLNLVQFSQDDHEDLPKVPLNAKWHIELRGNNNDFIFIILRSEDAFFQLAPVEIYSNRFNGPRMRYPQKNDFRFKEKDGIGWRQLIVVRAKHIKSQTRNDDVGYMCTINDLNQFASSIMSISENDIAADKYEFMLVSS